MSGIKDIWHYANNTINSARTLLNKQLKPLGLSSAEGNILLNLFNSEDVLRQEDLVSQLEVSRAAVSRALLSLENKGLITREKDELDKRVSRVHLTAKALGIGSEVQEIYEKIFTIAAHEISQAEIISFIGTFKRVSENFNKQRRA